MTGEIRQRFAKAHALVGQIDGLNVDQAAETIIHNCYYAMYHAAMAVLIARSGTAPAKHSSLIGQFGLLVKSIGETERDAGRLLRSAFDLRLVADYEVEPSLMASEARRVLAATPKFLDLCERLAQTMGNSETAP